MPRKPPDGPTLGPENSCGDLSPALSLSHLLATLVYARMSPDAAALSQPPHAGTRQDADAESFGFEKGDLAQLVTPPRFDSLDDERQYLKERIALACRIFAQYGLDHHIVSGDPSGYSVRGMRWVRRSRRSAHARVHFEHGIDVRRTLRSLKWRRKPGNRRR